MERKAVYRQAWEDKIKGQGEGEGAYNEASAASASAAPLPLMPTATPQTRLHAPTVKPAQNKAKPVKYESAE